MGFELFLRKQQAYNELMQAVEKIKAILPLLSQDETQALLEGMKNAINEIQQPRAVPLGPAGEGQHTEVTSKEEGGSHPPAKTVELELASHPEGLKAEDVVRLCVGKIVTTSQSPQAIVYSALAFLKKVGRVEQGEDKVYRLVRTSQNDLIGKTAIECCEIILREKGVPMHIMTLAREALSRGYVGRTTGDRDSVEMTTAKSFWAAMSRAPDVFELTTRETFRIKNPAH